MHIERIKEAVRYLKQVHLAGWNFSYNTWGSTMPGCGTIACAGGWLTQNKALREQGLRNSSPKNFASIDLVPWFEGKLGSDALAMFFDISGYESADIFIYARQLLNEKSGKKHSLSDITAWHIAELLEDLLPLEVDVVECSAPATDDVVPAGDLVPA